MLDFYKGKRVLITGHTGFKGSWLSVILNSAGAEVFGYSLKPQEGGMFEKCNLGKKISGVFADIRDYETLKKCFDEFKPEIVFHLAAQPIVLEGYNSPLYTFETNVMGTANLMECIKNSNSVKSVVNITTDKVYLNLDGNKDFKESDKLMGRDPYSASKSCSEIVTYSYNKSFFAEKGIAVSTARAGNVIGGGDFAPNRIIPDCISAAKEKKPVVLRNPNSIRPFQHVLEPLFAYLLIAEKQMTDISLSGEYNVGPNTEDCITTKELATIFCDEWKDGATFCVKQIENAPHESSFLKLNCDKIKTTLGWNPRWNIKDAVKNTVEWAKLVEDNDPYSVTEMQIKKFVEHK